MTIIAAMASADGDSITFGSDRMTTDSSIDSMGLMYPKWKSLGENVWIASTGFHLFSLALSELNAMDIRNAAKGGMVELHNLLREAVSKTLLPSISTMQDTDQGYDSEALIIIPGVGLYFIDTVLTPIPVPSGRFVSIGSGRRFANGAAHVLIKQRKPRAVVLHALEAACACCEACGGEIDIFTLEGKGDGNHKLSHSTH